jgi:hypothetical protein
MMMSPSRSPPLENEMQFRSQQFQPIKADPAAAINAEGIFEVDNPTFVADVIPLLNQL